MPPFSVSEAVYYAQKPNTIGLKRTVILYENMLWRNGEPKSGPPSPASIQYWVDLLAYLNYSGYLVLDIEHWPIYTDPVTRQYMVDIVNAFKVPGRKYQVGYYATVPQRNTIESLIPGSAGYLAWTSRNNAVQSIADACDALFPSLYSLHPDQFRWNAYVVENVKEARRLAKGKPVVGFMWPEYHPTVPLVGKTYVDQDLWKAQLQEARRLTDGIVVWKDADGQVWDPLFPWMTTLQEFMVANKIPA